MPERSNGAVSKTVVRASVPWVRIPLPPPAFTGVRSAGMNDILFRRHRIMSRIITAEEQQRIWEEEHRNPFVLLPMDSHEPSSGVVSFYEWIKSKNVNQTNAIEMGCGKGRNSIWLAQQGLNVDAFDFSAIAIKEANNRANAANISEKVNFHIHDATQPWPFKSSSFDFAFDIFASTDIVSFLGRSFAHKELIRVLKSKGYLFLYTLSTDDEFHKEMLKQSPGEEKNSFLHPTTGKFEKVFDRDEILDCYKELKLIEKRVIEKKANFFGKDYNCKHFWMVFQK